MTSKRLIASDYDGTLSCGGDSLEKNARAVSAWRKAGNLFGVVTGRGTHITAELAEHGFETDFVLCNNGAVCISGGEMIFAERNDMSLVRDVTKFISVCGAGYFGLVAPEYEKGFVAGKLPEDLDKLPQFTQLTAICADDDDASRISREINVKYADSLISYANGKFIDIVKRGISKAEGISRVARMLGVEENHISAVGDNYNDLIMIEAFDGYAVSGARELVKKRADHVVESVADMIDELIKNQSY